VGAGLPLRDAAREAGASHPQDRSGGTPGRGHGARQRGRALRALGHTQRNSAVCGRRWPSQSTLGNTRGTQLYYTIERGRRAGLVNHEDALHQRQSLVIREVGARGHCSYHFATWAPLAASVATWVYNIHQQAVVGHPQEGAGDAHPTTSLENVGADEALGAPEDALQHARQALFPPRGR
jgi:hypothetical protein